MATEKALSWEKLARLLADRLQYSDFCDNGHDTIEEGLAEGCPNCDDREAMRQYRLKVPPPIRVPVHTIEIHELRRTHEEA